jgi:sugar lactone lactonase YvrE
MFVILVIKCLSLSPLLPDNAHWTQHGIIIAGVYGQGDCFRQLCCPHGLVVDDDETVFTADWGNHRVIAMKKDDNRGHLVAGGQRAGNGLHQLHHPTDVLVDNERNRLIICDQVNSRVLRWPLNNGKRGEVLVDNIHCSR